LVDKGINSKVEDVLFNYTNATLMTIPHIGRAFKAVKEFHVITLQVFIDVFSLLDFVIMDLNCGTGICIHPSLVA
jgi:hypothetical protein